MKTCESEGKDRVAIGWRSTEWHLEQPEEVAKVNFSMGGCPMNLHEYREACLRTGAPSPASKTHFLHFSGIIKKKYRKCVGSCLQSSYFRITVCRQDCYLGHAPHESYFINSLFYTAKEPPK